jgi:hypothetical protein
MAASLLIGPHIEMSTLCDGLLYCSTVSSIRARLRPFYRNYINQSSFVEAVASRRRCSKRVSQGRHRHVGTFNSIFAPLVNYRTGVPGLKQDGD